jgi:RES domain-containing protein
VIVYRLHSQRYSAFDGTGAMLYGGRWNRRGTALIYTAESRALCALEVLVNAGQLADDYVVTVITIPDDLTRTTLSIDTMPGDWTAAIPNDQTRNVGSQWASGLESPVLAVPSAVIWRECNYILNPSHPAFNRIAFGPAEPFYFDERLKRMVLEFQG